MNYSNKYRLVVQSLFSGSKKQAEPEEEQPKKKGTTLRNPFQNFFGGTASIFSSGGSGRPGKRDLNTVFIAGGTGRLGSKILKEIVKSGKRVRIGARTTEKANEFYDTLEEESELNRGDLGRVKFYEFDLQDEESIRKAIGNAGKVVSALGAKEGNPNVVKSVDGDGTINLINAANDLGVKQFVLVSSMGAEKFGLPASLLNLFGGILSQKRRAEKSLQSSQLQYTIVRPGGMERPPDDYKLTHNLVLSRKNTKFGGQVSRQQVAELVQSIIAEPSYAENKVVEVYADNKAPERDVYELLDEIESEISQEDKEQKYYAYQQAESKIEKLQNYLDQVQDDISSLEEQAQSVQEQFQQLQQESKDILAEESQAQAAFENLQDQLQQQDNKEEELTYLIGQLKQAQKEDTFIDERQQNQLIKEFRQKKQLSADERKREEQLAQQKLAEKEQQKIEQRKAQEEARLQRQRKDKPKELKQLEEEEEEVQKPKAPSKLKAAPKPSTQPIQQLQQQAKQTGEQAQKKGQQIQQQVKAPVKEVSGAAKQAVQAPSPTPDKEYVDETLELVRKRREEQERVKKEEEERNQKYAAQRKAIEQEKVQKQEAEAKRVKDKLIKQQQQEQASAKAKQEADQKLQKELEEYRKSQQDGAPQSRPQPKQAKPAAKPSQPAAKPSQPVAKGPPKQPPQEALPNTQEAREWITNWRKSFKPQDLSVQEKTAAPKGQPQDSDVAPNTIEARQWIENWRRKFKPQDLPKEQKQPVGAGR